MPYPSMDAFDAPSREVCTVRRIRTNTPLQALVTLNDPVYIETAQALAGRILDEGGETLAGKLKLGFEVCTSREPKPEELIVLETTYKSLLSRFTEKETEAMKLKSLDLQNQVSIPTQAAWTVLANVLLNLDETLTVR